MMHYDKKGDPLPMIDPTDNMRPDKDANTTRQVVNNHHRALGEYQRRIDNVEISVGLLLIVCVCFTAWLLLLSWWVVA